MGVPTAVYEIELDENEVVLRSPEVGFERFVDMTSREHPSDRERTEQGHSVGWWETDTLVVDTARFADNIWGNGQGIPSGAQRHLVERFQLSGDGMSLTYGFVLDDAEYLTEAISGTVTWQYAPGLQAAALPCDPEVARRYLTEG
jgi:hypothetical protein